MTIIHTVTKGIQILFFLSLFSGANFAQWQNIGPGGGSDLQTIQIGRAHV